jgi:hypothetical protein
LGEILDTVRILNQFQKLFMGAREFFVVHAPPFSKSSTGKNTAHSVYYKKQGREFVPYEEHDLKHHLNGELGVALSPLVSVDLDREELRDVCCYAVIDIDWYDFDFIPLIQRMYEAGLSFVPFRSKSGGLHLYFFFSNFEPAAGVRAALQSIIQAFGLQVLFTDTKTKVCKVELFPEVDKQQGTKKTQCVFLPYFNVVGGAANGALDSAGNILPIEEALELCLSHITTLKRLEASVLGLPHNEAPYCLQALLLNCTLSEGSSRNVFLFAVGLYFKLKHNDSFDIDELLHVNSRLDDPLPESDVQSVFNSVQNGAYSLLSQCKKEPMVSYCNKKLCKLREFSAIPKKTKNLVANIELGTAIMVDAEDPYYLIEARMATSEAPFKILRIDSAEDLFNQRKWQVEVAKKLMDSFMCVKQQVWEEIIGQVLRGAVKQSIALESDTSELSELRSLFYQYLSYNQGRTESPFRIAMKQVYYSDHCFYFSTDGFRDYLRAFKFSVRINLREELLRYGCTEGVVDYVSQDGMPRTISCWKKVEDDVLRERNTHKKALSFELTQIAKESSRVLGTGKLIATGEIEDVDVDATSVIVAEPRF